jgi:hypothetical protein
MQKLNLAVIIFSLVIYFCLTVEEMHVNIFLCNKINVCLKTFAQTIFTAVAAVEFHQVGLLAGPERSVYLSTTELNLHFSAFPEAVSCSVKPWPQSLLHHVRHLNRSSDQRTTTITTASFFSSTFTAAQFLYQCFTANLCVIHHYSFLFIFFHFQTPPPTPSSFTQGLSFCFLIFALPHSVFPVKVFPVLYLTFSTDLSVSPPSYFPRCPYISCNL